MTRWQPRWTVLGFAALLFLWNLGGHDLWAPDEPYFGEGAREMVVDGEWLVPHVNGVVTTDKPPLFFWTIAVLSLPGGEVTPWTARLPSALAALGILLLVIRLGRRFGGEQVVWLAPLILATTLMFWEKARWAQIDALLCLLIWVALSAFETWRADETADRARGRRAGLLFWLAVALAVLAKGPVGLLLPLGIALVTLAVDRRLARWKGFAPVSGPLLFALVVGFWMTLATVGSAPGALPEPRRPRDAPRAAPVVLPGGASLAPAALDRSGARRPGARLAPQDRPRPLSAGDRLVRRRLLLHLDREARPLRPTGGAGVRALDGAVPRRPDVLEHLFLDRGVRASDPPALALWRADRGRGSPYAPRARPSSRCARRCRTGI